jgi:hypothetical protein
MKPGLLLPLAALALLIATPPPAARADGGARASDHVSAAKKKKKARPQAVYVTVPARRGWVYRSDPSFDPYGRPWRPNFYAPCYEDLGYGRFRDCSGFR